MLASGAVGLVEVVEVFAKGISPIFSEGNAAFDPASSEKPRGGYEAVGWQVAPIDR